MVCVRMCAPVYMNVVHKNQYQLEICGQILPCTAKDTCHWRSKVSEDGAHFLLRKPKLKMRKTIVMMIPQVARTPSITVTAMCTVTVSSFGTPSYGIPSTDRQENGQYVVASFQAIQRDLRMRLKHVNDMYCRNTWQSQPSLV